MLEELFDNENRNKLSINKQRFHDNFRIAKKAHQIAGDMSAYCDEQLIKKWMMQMKKEGNKRFILFSGYWIPVIIKYKEILAQNIFIDCIHMESVYSNSWKRYSASVINENQIWMFGTNKQVFIPYEIDNQLFNTKQIIIHGGGWGMGLLQEAYERLKDSGYVVYRVAYNQKEYETFYQNDKNVYYMDEQWNPWVKDEEGEFQYPIIYKGNKLYSLDKMLVENEAIVSKPGGGTLLDSLVLKRPIILTQALSGYEKKNSDLWKKLGYGMDFEEWEQCKFTGELLRRMRTNLYEYKNNAISVEEELCSLGQV